MDMDNKPKARYYMIYRLKGQSLVFGDPQYFETDDLELFLQALDTAKRCGYFIEYSTNV